MDSLKSKLGVVAVVVCMAAAAVLVWYLLFAVPESGASPDGTLVMGIPERLVIL